VPTAAELVEAVDELLREEVMAETSGKLHFDALVAANVLGMVARELEMGAGAARAHEERLRALGVADDGELVAAIRQGAFDERAEELVQALRASTRERLAMANPRYLSDDDPV
jgi:hypothetical protein